MRKAEGMMLTTRVDLDGERFDPDGLNSFVASMNDHYLPLTLEHDIRNAPIGRIASAAIVPLEEGEFAVKGIFEIFEENDTASSLHGDGRRIRIENDETPSFNIGYDRSYETPEGRELLAALSRLSPESRVTFQTKKSLEPISTLVIAAAIATGAAIAGGFFKKLGEDLYSGLKNILKAHFDSRKESRDRLLVFQFTMIRGAELVEVQVVLTNPSAKEIDSLFSQGFAELDSYLLRCSGLKTVGRFVFEYKDGRLESLYALRNDCVPMRLYQAPRQ
jgi:hypothetical protein